jgi:hypothetical protein
MHAYEIMSWPQVFFDLGQHTIHQLTVSICSSAGEYWSEALKSFSFLDHIPVSYVLGALRRPTASPARYHEVQLLLLASSCTYQQASG